MPFNGSGIYAPPGTDFPAVAGTLITAVHFNNVINDLATALSNAVTRDGQSPMSANLPMGGFKAVNVADGTSRTAPTAHYASLGQYQDGTALWGGVAGGTADALTITLNPSIPAYVTGQTFLFKSSASPNATTTPTIAVNALAAKTIQVEGGAVAIGQIAASTLYRITYDGTNFQLSALTAVSLAGGNAFSGIVTVLDDKFFILDDADQTKKIKFEIGGLTTATTRTLTLQDTSGTVALISEFAYVGLPSSSGRLLLPNDYISGFSLTNNGATGFDVAAGQAMDSTNVFNIIGAAIANKTQSAWVAGTVSGGKLSAAAMANNTWYYWFALWKTVDGTVDYGFDVSTTPTLPGGYSKFRYIGARKTQAASTNWDTFIQHGDQVNWSTPPALDLNGTTTTANRTLTTMNVPAVKVEWLGNGGVALPALGVSNGMVVTDPACADVVPALTASPLFSLGGISGANAGQLGGQLRCWTNSSSQIGVRANSANTYYLQTIGWIDPRGKPV